MADSPSYQDLLSENEALRRRLAESAARVERCRLTEQHLQVNEARLRRAADSAGVVVYDFDLRPGGQRILQGIEGLTGFTPDEDFTLQCLKSRIHPEDASAYVAAFEEQLHDGGVIKSTFRILHASGEWLHVESSREVVLDYEGKAVRLVGVLVNIDQRVQAEAAVRESEARYRRLADTVPQIVFTATAAGLMEYVNRTGLDYIGWTLDEAMGLGWLAAIHPDDRQMSADRWLECIKTGTPYEFEHRLRRADGEYRWQLANAVPVQQDGGGIVRWIGTSTDIQDRKKAEETLRHNEEFVRRITEVAPSILYVYDMERRCSVWGNRGLYEGLGYGAGQLAKISGHLLETLLHPDDWVHYQDHAEALQRLADGEVAEFECRMRHADGTWRWLHTRDMVFRRTHDGRVQQIVGAAIDLTERKRAEVKLRESEERLRLALVAGRMGAWDVDLATDETRWDAKEYALLGLTDGSVIPSPAEFYRRVHPDDLPLVKRSVQRAVEETGALEHEFRILSQEGAVRWLAAKGQVLKDDEGRPVRMVGMNFDVTERKRTEDRLRSFALELETRVEERTQELMQSEKRLRALATDLSLTEQRERKRLAIDLHDYLAQLLALVRMRLGQIKRVTQAPEQAVIVQETEHVVNEALTYTRTLVAQLSPPVLRNFGLPMALKWLGEQMVRQELSVEVRQLSPDQLQLPEDQAVLLFQSVRELLINVRKHAKTDRAVVTLEQIDDSLCLAVRDDGAGMDLTGVSAVPETSSATSSKFGLLSIRERMLALGGRLEVDSKPGQGMTARLILPLRAAATTEDSGVRTQPARSIPERSRLSPQSSALASDSAFSAQQAALRQQEANAIRVLLVDDHAMVRHGLKGLLQERPGIQIVGEAWDGEEAIAFVDRLRPHVVLMDVNMPNIDGIEATRRIKAAFKSVAIVGLSVNASREVAEAMRTAGADEFLSKNAPADAIYQALCATACRAKSEPSGIRD